MHLKEIVVRKRHHVNMGNFENAETEFSATFVADPDDDPDEVGRQAHEYVDEQLSGDLDRASKTTAVANSYVDDWLDGPRRAKRTAVRRTR